MSGPVLVLGATGTVGRPLVETLVTSGVEVRAASRSGKPVGGAAGFVFDYADTATIGPAFDGVHSAYVMLASGYADAKGLLTPVIAAAAERGVGVVLQTAIGVDADDAIPYRQVELALIGSGTPHAILRPNWFADNFHTFWKPGLAHGMIALPAGTGATSFIDVRDIAASAAALLTAGRLDGQAHVLTGPEALTYAEAAELLSAVTGRPVAYQATSDAAFVAMLTGAGVSEEYARFLATIFDPVREGWTATVTDAVERLTGRPPRSLAIYAHHHAADLAA